MDNVAKAIAGPVMHGFDGWRLDKPVIWEQITESDRTLLGNIAECAKVAAYAPDRITPEVVEAAARGMGLAIAESEPGTIGFDDMPQEHKGMVCKVAKAAILAAFAVLGGA
jgi:hypothetical protein